MKTKITKCICASDENDSIHSGMPILIPSPNMEYWEIRCPVCKRGGLQEFKSPYLAVKDWNEMQDRVRRLGIF